MQNDFENLLQEVKIDIEKEFYLINATMSLELKNDIDLINNITEYILMYSGKRLRSVLIILIVKMLDNKNIDKAVFLSSAVEFIHMATLMHDDVIDEGILRHGVDTSNKIWGNKNSVLIGDFLFAKSFELMVKCNNINVLATLSSSSSLIAKGEIMQMIFYGNFDITVDEYLSVIKHKTAYLFAAATKSACMLTTDDITQVESCFNYGMNLGFIFQIIDDLLDYFGKSDDTGKKLGKDFYEKKITLPLILLLKESNDGEKQKIYHITENDRDLQGFLYIKDLMEKYNILKKLMDFISIYKNNAMENLANFEHNKYRQYLIAILEKSIYRIK